MLYLYSVAQKDWWNWFVGSGPDVQYMNHHMCVSLYVHYVSALIRRGVSLFWDQAGDTDVISLHLERGRELKSESKWKAKYVGSEFCGRTENVAFVILLYSVEFELLTFILVVVTCKL